MKRHEDIRKMPIYKKAELIFKLVESLYATLPNDDVLIEATKEFMRGDAMILSAKIAGAEGGDLYAIRMQNAALIREHAMHLYVQVGSLRFHENYADLEYVELIRKEIENFRELFIEWIHSFDTSNYIWDDWELFNPPGAIKPSSDD